MRKNKPLAVRLGTAMVLALTFWTLCMQAGCPAPKAPYVQCRLVNSSVLKPSNIALYFAVQSRDGVPIAGLDVKSFRIFEDGKLISPYESKQTILNPEVAVGHYILLLLDLSGSITDSGSLPKLLGAANAFSDRVTKSHPIAVYGFDGRPKLIPISPFTTNSAQVRAALAKLSEHKTKDPSTNLNGAVVNAIKILETQLGRSNRPLRFATLVIFTDGTDRAHRVTPQKMYETLQASSVNVFVIGLGGEISEQQLARLGRDGFIRATDQDKITAAFDQVARGIESAGKKFYLLSYCSPSRAGQHRLRVDVRYQGKTGSLSHEFNAKGFGPKCDPNQKPRFSLRRVRFKK